MCLVLAEMLQKTMLAWSTKNSVTKTGKRSQRNPDNNLEPHFCERVTPAADADDAASNGKYGQFLPVATVITTEQQQGARLIIVEAILVKRRRRSKVEDQAASRARSSRNLDNRLDRGIDPQRQKLQQQQLLCMAMTPKAHEHDM